MFRLLIIVDCNDNYDYFLMVSFITAFRIL